MDYGDKTEFKNEALGLKVSRKNDKIANDNMDDLSFYNFLLASFQNYNDSMRVGAALYCFHADSQGLAFRQALKDAGIETRQVLIWEKNTFVLGRQDYQWRHEPILYGWKDGSAHYFINDRTQDTVLLDDEIDFASMKKQELLAFIEQLRKDYQYQTTVQYENKPSRNSLHPTMKPVPLIGRLMNNSSKAGWTVGDFFGGSGSTLIAAEQLGRACYMMECEPRNVDIIIKRWEDYTAQKAVILRE